MPSKRKAGSLAKAQGSEKGNRVKKRRWGKRLDPSNVYVASGKQAEEDKNPYKFDVGKQAVIITSDDQFYALNRF